MRGCKLDLKEVVTLVNRRSTDLRAYITPAQRPPNGVAL